MFEQLGPVENSVWIYLFLLSFQKILPSLAHILFSFKCYWVTAQLHHQLRVFQSIVSSLPLQVCKKWPARDSFRLCLRYWDVIFLDSWRFRTIWFPLHADAWIWNKKVPKILNPRSSHFEKNVWRVICQLAQVIRQIKNLVCHRLNPLGWFIFVKIERLSITFASARLVNYCGRYHYNSCRH